MGRPWEAERPPFRCPPFASYVPVRTPAWLSHDNVEQARAFKGTAAGEVWKYDGSWQRIEVHER